MNLSSEDNNRIESDNSDLYEILDDIGISKHLKDGTLEEVPLFNVKMGTYIFSHSLTSSDADHKKLQKRMVSLYARRNMAYVIEISRY